MMKKVGQARQYHCANTDGDALNEILVVDEEAVQAVEGAAAMVSVMVASSTRCRVQVSVGGGGEANQSIHAALEDPPKVPIEFE